MIPPPPIPLENAPPPSSSSAADATAAPGGSTPRPCREVSKFRDDYGLMWRYCSRFEFEFDENFDYTKSEDYLGEEDSNCEYNPRETRETLVRYVNQIRKSFGFDVDCHPPNWFYGDFTPITVTQYQLNGDVGEVTNFAVAEINAETGKMYKIVEVEKVVAAHVGILFSTIRVKDEGDGDGTEEKVIQAIACKTVCDRELELLQWRYKPDEEEVWLELPPLPPQPPTEP